MQEKDMIRIKLLKRFIGKTILCDCKKIHWEPKESAVLLYLIKKNLDICRVVDLETVRKNECKTSEHCAMKQ